MKKVLFKGNYYMVPQWAHYIGHADDDVIAYEHPPSGYIEARRGRAQVVGRLSFISIIEEVQ